MSTKTPTVIIGFGSQAKAWCHNFHLKKRPFRVALRKESSSLKEAQSLGYATVELGPELNQYNDFVLLIPDHLQAQVLLEISSELREGARIVYAHGYALTRHKLAEQHPTFSHLLFAPKAIANAIRETGLGRNSFKAVIGLEYSKSFEFDHDWLVNLAKDLFCDLPLIQSSAKEEMTADLFSEQSLLCSLIPYGALHSFNFLVGKGISPDVAYIECWKEVKLIADAMISKGPRGLFELISPTALVGGERAKNILFDQNYEQKLQKIYDDIESGQFFQEFDNLDPQQCRATVLSEWQKEAINAMHNKWSKDK
ncbi:MAG: ketol-acid reductoisomerase [Bdellovibrio sp.]